jgi:hypothetical protein
MTGVSRMAHFLSFSWVNEMSMNLILDCLGFLSQLDKHIVKMNHITQKKKKLLNYVKFSV